MADPVKFTLEIEKGEHGLWYVTSPEIDRAMRRDSTDA